MRIDRIEIRNFKKFSDYTLTLHPQFTLLVGDNGTGKTTLLDALAIAARVWLVNAPDTTLSNSKRNILTRQIRLEAIKSEDITQFIEHKPVQITAIGCLGEQQGVQWLRQISAKGSRTSNAESKKALKIIENLFQKDKSGEKIWFPVIAYYGAGRAWLPSSKSDKKPATAPEYLGVGTLFMTVLENESASPIYKPGFKKKRLPPFNTKAKCDLVFRSSNLLFCAAFPTQTISGLMVIVQKLSSLSSSNLFPLAT